METSWIGRFLRRFIFSAFVKPFVKIVLGLNIHGREKIPAQGPLVIVANHNSHLDTAVLMSLFPMNILHSIHPVAAADYFLRNPVISWFSRNIVGIIPIARSRDKNSAVDPLASISEALKNKSIVIFFPEGTRGEAEVMVSFKKGIAKLAERHPEVPVLPLYLHGLGKSLPKGEKVFVPFMCDCFVGETLKFSAVSAGTHDAFVEELEARIRSMARSAKVAPWI